jgi:hypothetical protein
VDAKQIEGLNVFLLLDEEYHSNLPGLALNNCEDKNSGLLRNY